jgi:predicted transcriptional regulator
MRQKRKEGEKGMNVNKLKGKVVEKGYTVETLAEMLDIHTSSMYRKLNNFEKITIGEAKKLKEGLEISEEEACEIFLS